MSREIANETTLQEVEQMAREAGRLLLSRFGQPHDIRFKGAVDLVTEADHLSEKYLLDYLARNHPTHRVISEESGLNGSESDHSWIIDPLDGTVNFAHGIPFYCVSIAYAIRGEVQLGVVYDPGRDECFSAQKNLGAWCNGDPIHVSATAVLLQALLATGFPYEKDAKLARNLELYSHFAIHSRGVRRYGAAALDLCYLADGRYDGYWELVVNPWDVAAGGLIAAEAGALVTSTTGGPLRLEMATDILAANPELHALLLGVLHPG